MAANNFNVIETNRLFTSYHKLLRTMSRNILRIRFCFFAEGLQSLRLWSFWLVPVRKDGASRNFSRVSSTWSLSLGLGQRHEFIKSAMFSVFASTAPKELIGRVPNSRSVGFAEHSSLFSSSSSASCHSFVSLVSLKSSSWSSSSSTTSFARGDEDD